MITRKTEDVDKICNFIEVTGEITKDYKKAKEDDGKVSWAEWISITGKNVGKAIGALRSIPEICDELVDFEADEAPEVEAALLAIGYNPSNPYVKLAALNGVKALAYAKNAALDIIKAKDWEEENK